MGKTAKCSHFSKMGFKVPAEKNVFSGAVTKIEKNGVLKYHIIILVAMTSEHPDAVTVKNCVLKYTPETCVLKILFSNTVTNFFYS